LTLQKKKTLFDPTLPAATYIFIHITSWFSQLWKHYLHDYYNAIFIWRN